jgi:hypothetical protein
MKSSTYGSFVMLMFIRNIDKTYCDSIQQVVNLTDSLAAKFGISVELSYMTRYLIVKNLVSEGILIMQRSGKNQKIKLSQKYKSYAIERILEKMEE